MNIARPLPAREPPLPAESLASLVLRNSLAMGYEGTGRLRALLGEGGDVPFHLNHLPTGAVLDRLSSLLAARPDDLLRLTFHRFAPTLMLGANQRTRTECDGKTILKFFVSSHSPVCPKCLAADPQPYDRLAWSLRAVPVCLTHGVVLVTACAACQRAVRAGRNHTTICKCGHRLSDVAALHLSLGGCRLAKTLLGWFQGQDIPWKAAPEFLWWIGRLAVAAARTPAWLEPVAADYGLSNSRDDDLIAWLGAAEMTVDWPGRFMEFLDAFQQVPKYGASHTGVAFRFGLLLRDAADLEDRGLTNPADVLRQYLTQRYVGGHINAKTVLFRRRNRRHLLDNKAWLTQTEAGQSLGVRSPTINALVRKGMLDGCVHDAGPKGRTIGLVSRASVRALKHEIASALTVKQAAARLGLGRHRVLELIAVDLLGGAVKVSRAWRIPRRSVEDLLGALVKLPVCRSADDRWITAQMACRDGGRSGVTLVRILGFVLTGRLQAARLEGYGDLRGLLVSRGSLKGQLSVFRQLEHESGGYPLSRLARLLFPGRPIKGPLLKKWIDAGFLEACRKGRTTLISAEAVRKFHRDYCLAEQACRVLGITRSTLHRWESAGRVTAVYGPRVRADAGVSLFRRADIDRLLAHRST